MESEVHTMKETSNTPNRDALIKFIKMLTPAEVEKICNHKRFLELVGKLKESEVIFLETLADKLFIAQKNA